MTGGIIYAPEPAAVRRCNARSAVGSDLMPVWLLLHGDHMNVRLILLAGLASFTVSAQAQNAPAAPAAPPAPSVRDACKADYQKLCAGVQQGGGRILECLNSHNGELTTGCQEALRQAAPKTSGAQDPASKPQ
jgi:hypothetical protein